MSEHNNGGKQCFPPEIRNQRCGVQSQLLTFHVCRRVPCQCSKAEKEVKGIQIGKEEMKLSLLVDNMVIYVENPENLQKSY